MKNPSRLPLRLLSLWGPLAALCLAPVTYAQTATPASTQKTATTAKEVDEPITISTFEVTTKRDIGYLSTNAAQVTRMDTSIEDIPMSVTIFNQQFIDDLGATDTSQLLDYESSAVKTGENDNFIARGSSTVATNFLDGFPQTSGFGSQPLFDVERVEVIRGPAAILYGGDGYGGVYNRITKQPETSQRSSGRMILSEDHTLRAEIDNTGPLPFVGGKKLLYRITGILDNGDTWFGQRRREQGFAPSLAWNVGQNTKIILQYLYDWRETQASWSTPVHAGDPYGMTTGDGVYHTIPRNVAWVSPDDYRHNTRKVYSFDLRHAFTEKLQLRSQFQYESKLQNNLETVESSDAITIIKDAVLGSRYWRYQPRNTRSYRSRNELVWKVSTGPIKHQLLFGHSWIQTYDLNQSQRSCRNNGGLTGTALTGNGKLTDAKAGPTFNYYPNLSLSEFLANPRLAGYNTNNLLPLNLLDRGAEPAVPAVADRSPLYLETKTRSYLSNRDIYANDIFSFWKDRFVVMAGVRQAKYAQKTIAFAGGTFPNKVLREVAPTTYNVADATTSGVGLVWHARADKKLSLYTNLNNSFSPTYQVQPDGSQLDPEEGRQKEVGIRFSLFNSRISGSFSWFDLTQSNVPQADTAVGRDGYYIQVNGERSTGMELNFNGRVTDNWLVLGGVSDTDSRNDNTGVALARSPRYRFTMFNRFNIKRGTFKNLNFSLGTIYTGVRNATTATARGEPQWGRIPAEWRVDTILGYKYKLSGATYTVSLKVNNVFDNQNLYYIANAYSFTISPGREWQLIVGTKF
jgi:outer membrane receptor protein involved in Fe transport